MSRENVEIVRSLWPPEVDLVELTQSPAPPEVVDGLDADLEVIFHSGVPGANNPSYLGVTGFVQGWRDWLEPFESYRLKMEDVIDAGDDNVLIAARVTARTRRDGVVVEHSPAAICTVRDGQVTQVAFHLDRAQAFAAVGLRE